MNCRNCDSKLDRTMLRCPICGMKNELYTGIPEVIKRDVLEKDELVAEREPTTGMHAYYDFWKRIFLFSGESTLKEFVIALTGNLIVAIFLLGLVMTFYPMYVLIFARIMPILYILMHLPISIRRLRHVDCHGALVLCFYVPVTLTLLIYLNTSIPWFLWIPIGLVFGSLVLYLTLQLFRNQPEDRSMIVTEVTRTFEDIQASNFGGGYGRRFLGSMIRGHHYRSSRFRSSQTFRGFRKK